MPPAHRTSDSPADGFCGGYDSDSRLETVTYPPSAAYTTGLVIENVYTLDGYLYQVQNASETGSPVLWQADDMNAEGQLLAVTWLNGLDSVMTYDPETGRPLTDTLNDSTTEVRKWTYDWDTFGNLTQRRQDRDDLTGSLVEDFDYDTLNRLTDSQVVGQSAKAYGYNAIGNFTSKTGLGNYSYGTAAGPHAVTSADGVSYTYDANGNMVSKGNGQIDYSSYNKPVCIDDNAFATRFVYDADRNRIKYSDSTSVMCGQTGSDDVVRYYVTDPQMRFEVEDDGANVTSTHYVYAGDESIAIIKSVDGSSSITTTYLHRDHLGSIDTVTDENGDVIEHYAYDPHGKRSNPDTWADATVLAPDEIHRGFTGHEHIDSLGLIHMNGRVYDPHIGRMMSADPFVPDPTDGQAYNRYSYVINNPLVLTDASGFQFGSDSQGIFRSTFTFGFNGAGFGNIGAINTDFANLSAAFGVLGAAFGECGLFGCDFNFQPGVPFIVQVMSFREQSSNTQNPAPTAPASSPAQPARGNPFNMAFVTLRPDLEPRTRLLLAANANGDGTSTPSYVNAAGGVLTKTDIKNLVELAKALTDFHKIHRMRRAVSMMDLVDVAKIFRPQVVITLRGEETIHGNAINTVKLDRTLLIDRLTSGLFNEFGRALKQMIDIPIERFVGHTKSQIFGEVSRRTGIPEDQLRFMEEAMKHQQEILEHLNERACRGTTRCEE